MRTASAFVIVALAVVLCACGGVQPVAEKRDAVIAPKTDWGKVKSLAKIGDVEVMLVGARNLDINGFTFGNIDRMGNMLVVQIRFENTSKAKRVKFGGWQGDPGVKVTDEHGNPYGFISFASGFSFHGTMGALGDPGAIVGCDQTFMIANPTNLDPGKKYLRHLFVDKSIDAAKEVRVTVPAKELGGEGSVFLRALINR